MAKKTITQVPFLKVELEYLLRLVMEDLDRNGHTSENEPRPVLKPGVAIRLKQAADDIVYSGEAT